MNNDDRAENGAAAGPPTAGAEGRRVPAAILISGRGSNMTALLDAAEDPTYPARFVLVLSNRPEAAGLDHARQKGIDTAVVDHKGFSSREAFEAAIEGALVDAGARMVCLAGFMRVLTAGFTTRWQDRLVNIHPSILPAFRGLDTHARALAAGAKLHGCTVHLVRADVDDGPILMQAAVPVLPDDDAATLAARVLVQEHRIYPEAVRQLLAPEHGRSQALPDAFGSSSFVSPPLLPEG